MLTPPFRFLWNITTEGLEHVPSTGGAVIAPNHVSVLDSFFVPLTLHRQITYVGKAEYMDSWKTRVAFPAMGMIPIDRSGGDSSRRALDAAARVLESGQLFGIYPEGTRSRDGRLHKGHTGLARLALRTGAPIVPVGIIGSDAIQPPDVRFPKPFRRVHIRFGRPIDVEHYADRADDRLILRQITDEVMYEIRNLSGQQYVDAYAGKATRAATVSSETKSASAPTSRPVLESEHQVAKVVPLHDPTGETRTPVSASGSDHDHDDDGVERRSSTAVLRMRPLDLELELSTA